MGTFSAYFKKEITESVRTYRYLLIAAGIIVLAAIGTPVMYKLLPYFLKGQIQGDLSSLFKVSKQMVYSMYPSDLYKNASIFVLLGLSGIMAEEMTNQRFVFPFLKGANPLQIVLAKAVHYILATSVMIIVGALLNYYYVSLLFEGEGVKLSAVMISSLLSCLYYAFYITFLMLLSSLFKRGIVAGILTFLISAVSAALVNIKAIAAYVPYKLIAAGSAFSTDGILKAVIFAAAGCIVFGALSAYRLSRVEAL